MNRTQYFIYNNPEEGRYIVLFKFKNNQSFRFNLRNNKWEMSFATLDEIKSYSRWVPTYRDSARLHYPKAF